jgi:hypothetical protein
MDQRQEQIDKMRAAQLRRAALANINTTKNKTAYENFLKDYGQLEEGEVPDFPPTARGMRLYKSRKSGRKSRRKKGKSRRNRKY